MEQNASRNKSLVTHFVVIELEDFNNDVTQMDHVFKAQIHVYCIKKQNNSRCIFQGLILHAS